MIVAVPLLGNTSPAYAAGKTWDGGAGTSNWGDGGNWDPNGVPGPNDDVTIGKDKGTIKTDGSQKTVKSLTLEKADAGGTTLTADGPSKSVDIKASGDITIGDGNTVRGCDGNATKNGGDAKLESTNGDVTNDGELKGGDGGERNPGDTQAGNGGNVKVKGKNVRNDGTETAGGGGTATGAGQRGGNGGNVENVGTVSAHGGDKTGGAAGTGPGGNGAPGNTTTKAPKQVSLVPGDTQGGTAIYLGVTVPAGLVSLAGLDANALTASSRICIYAANGTVDLTGISSGTVVMTTDPGGTISIAGNILTDPGVSVNDIAEPDPVLHASPECLCAVLGCPGGVAEAPDVDASSLEATTSGGSSSAPYAAIAGAAAGGALLLGAGGWYARRRWLS